MENSTNSILQDIVELMHEILSTFSTATSPLIAVLLTPCIMAILMEMIYGIVPENAQSRDESTDFRAAADTAVTFVLIFVALFFCHRLEKQVSRSRIWVSFFFLGDAEPREWGIRVRLLTTIITDYVTGAKPQLNLQLVDCVAENSEQRPRSEDFFSMNSYSPQLTQFRFLLKNGYFGLFHESEIRRIEWVLEHIPHPPLAMGMFRFDVSICLTV